MKLLPIIAYHAVERGPGPLCLPPEVLARHVEILAASGCVTLTVAEAWQRLSSGDRLPERAVALTFDDGYASVHEAALPILAAAGMRATVFPVTGQLGGRSAWNGPGADHLRLMGSTRLRELNAAGWEIGAHTHGHPPLPPLDEKSIREELVRSNDVLEDLLGEAVTSFAYPYGWHNTVVRALARSTYDACLEVGAGRARAACQRDRIARIDAWYLQRSWSVEHLHDVAGGGYLLLRRLARASRSVLQRGTAPGVPDDE